MTMTADLLTGPWFRVDPDISEPEPAADRSVLGTAEPSLLTGDLDTLMRASFTQMPAIADYEAKRRRYSVSCLTRYLADYPGDTWQARWVASGLDRGGVPWPDEQDHSRRLRLFKGARTLICLGVIQPDYPWLLDTSFAWLFSTYREANNPDAFATLETELRNLRVRDRVASEAVLAATRICIYTGKTTPDAITADDIIRLDGVVRTTRGQPRRAHEALWRVLHTRGQIGGPTSLRANFMRGQLRVEQLVDRYKLRCRPIRNLIVDYMSERAAALDYESLSNVAFWLAKMFWADLEHHHPGIDSLDLDPAVAAAWKKRIKVRIDRSTGVEVRRSNWHSVIMCVRAFYLDINQWAHEDPSRWAVWAAPCPIRRSEVDSRNKHKAHVTAKMHARTRTLAEFVPEFIATATRRRQHAQALLAATAGRPIGAEIGVDDVVYEVVEVGAARRQGIRVQPPSGAPIDPVAEEAEAFWAWGVIEVLRLSGLRIEEVLELTHLSIRRYTQADGQVVPLLQVAPSKMDTERIFPISPELAHVLAQIVERVRGEHATVPLCPRFDSHERTYSPPLPHLFQRQWGGGAHVFSPATVRNWLDRTLARANLRDVDGTRIRFTPHDFRRLFATHAVNTGLPIHIAAEVLGHRALDTTRGYAAVYPEEVIRHYQAFILERRATRPSKEYRTPTDDEWAEFEQHFTLRKVAYGNCDRPYGSPCAHEHACVRCPMLRPEPSRLPLMRELETNLTERIDQARARSWLGEVEGLQQTLMALRDKTQQAERLVTAGITDTPASLS
jgi:integrase